MLVSMNHSFDRQTVHITDGGGNGDSLSTPPSSNNYEIVETYEEPFSLDDFYQKQLQEAEEMLAIYDDAIAKTEDEIKRLKKMGDDVLKEGASTENSIRATEIGISQSLATYQYGTGVEETFGVSKETWLNLTYDEQRQLYLEKTEEGKKVFPKYQRFQDNLDEFT